MITHVWENRTSCKDPVTQVWHCTRCDLYFADYYKLGDKIEPPDDDVQTADQDGMIATVGACPRKGCS
jgi:hypothetical protein